MSDKTHAQLKEEATALGLSYKGNTSKEALEAMIEEFYEASENESKVEVIKMEDAPVAPTRSKDAKTTLRQMVADAKKAAFKKRVVTLTNNDTRENQHVTAVPLFFENQYFALDRIVPLNIAVELEQCLIDIAKGTTIAMHKKGSTDGGRTVGNTVFAKKFNISYEEANN